ncbi:MAG: sigma-70 family RNA polymerase sigma factor [Deltaproteobacteria bacterium]
MSTDPPSLIEGLRRADPLAFETLYEREKAGLYGFLLRLARDPHVASDLFQNVWLKLARHAARLRSDSNLRAWLFTVARHEYASFRRAQALDLSRVLALGLEPREPDDSVERDTQRLAFAAALGRLSDADREVVLLAGVAGLDAEAAAEVLGISAVAFRQRLARARRRLGEHLREPLPGTEIPEAAPKGVR